MALIALELGPSTGIAAAEPPSSTLTLDVQLTAANSLPDGARPGMLSQTESIWRHSGVSLRWQTANGEAAPAGSLRVIVLERETVIQRPDAWPVGELIPDHSGGYVVLASIAAARRVIQTAGLDDEPQRLREHRLGVVLGRTIAHEIGHYLLRTSQHGRHGLMRREILSEDFADLRERQFFLDSTAANWIRRAYAGPTTGAVRPASFDYEQ
jgi:hypothetical protein